MLIKKERIPVLHIALIGFLPSFLKKFIYRLKGYTIGKNVSINLGAVIIGKKVDIANGVKIGFLTIIRGKEITIKRYVKIGSMSVIDTEKIFIDEDARINEQVYIGGMKTPQSSLHLGKRAIIMQMSYLNPTLPITIGDDSGIGGHCLFFTHGSWNNQLEGFPVKFAPITLGKKVWLPWRVFVMPGITIGDEVVIGANSLITTDIPSNSLAAGNPAKILKQDYPKRPSQEQKFSMLDVIFKDFFEFITYNGFVLETTKTNSGFESSLTKDGQVSSLIYTTNNSIDKSRSNNDQVIILFETDEKTMHNLLKSGYKMVLSINNTMRLGTSNVGEEITTFLSRYGMRFTRLD